MDGDIYYGGTGDRDDAGIALPAVFPKMLALKWS
jgi:hypothetical protein